MPFINIERQSFQLMKRCSTIEFTLILYVNDIVGMLAQVLNTISQLQLSVLTIHQSVPMEDKATITLSLNAQSSHLSVDDVVNALRR